MSDNNYPEIIWWREVPVDVEWGLLDYLADKWKNRIYVVCSDGFEEARSDCKWSEVSNSNIEIIYENDSDQSVKAMINDLYDKKAIHLFSGIRGKHKKHLDLVKKLKDSESKCVLISEPPSLFGNKHKVRVKKVIYRLLYCYYHIKYDRLFSAFFTLGSNTSRIYASYGWDKSKHYPFMYLPRLSTTQNTHDPEDGLKMLYLGRFRDSTKGVLMIKEAFDMINPEYYNRLTLDLVGGYGENKDELIEWAATKDNVRFLGKWNAENLCDNISQYDVCIVPSRFEGWNLMPYQAMFSGSSCIVSDGAGSDILVKDGGFGLVFPANDSNAFKMTLETAINNIEQVKLWKNNAVKYQKKVNGSVVGKYFVDCLLHIIQQTEIKPKCPWENNKL